jgi:hypothetical protein
VTNGVACIVKPLTICLFVVEKKKKMANGFGVYEEFLNVMRSDTMEEVMPSTQVTWLAVENTTIGIDKSSLDFADLKDVLTQMVSPGEGWGSVTEEPDTSEAVVATVLTINEAFTWMATFPGMVLIGTFTLGGKCYLLFGVQNIVGWLKGIDKLVQNKPIYVPTVYGPDGAVKVTGAISFLTSSTEGEYIIRNPIQ